MRASMPLSTSSPAAAEVRVSTRRSAGVAWEWVLALLLLALYVAPWMTSGSAALSFGGYDLGEWASLPPGVRSATPPLVASFLLRLPLTIIVLYLAFASPYRRLSAGWLVTGAAGLLLVVAQLPPLEFFTVFRGDPNYAQQAALALVSLVGVVIGLGSAPALWRCLAAAALAAVGAVAGIAGVQSARALMAAYQIDAEPGAAVWLMALVFAAAALWSAYRFVRSFAQP